MKYIIKRTFLQNNNYCFIDESMLDDPYLDEKWTEDINKSLTLDDKIEAKEWVESLEEEQEDNIKYKYEIIKVKETFLERKVEII